MAVVEPSPEGEAGASALDLRLRQQRILADFGVEALRSRELTAMLQRAAELCASGMGTTLAKVLEYQAGRDTLLILAGTGWRPGVVGTLEMGADMESPAGFAFKTGESVISNHLADESRFRTPAFMAEHGVRRAINVLIEVAGRSYGVLEVDSRDEGSFEADDLQFMRGFANLLGVAIERQHAEERLQDAVRHQELLTREASHRVKNSLSIVSAMLSLQIQQQDDEAVVRVLSDAQARILTIAQAHDQLWRGDQVGMVDLRDLLGGLVDRLAQQSPDHEIHCSVPSIVLSADAAIPLGLLATELITNAIKYAYPEGGGTIRLDVTEAGGRLTLEVTDRGVGLPDGFDATASARTSLGMRMVQSLSRQLRGDLHFADAAPGTRAGLTMDDPRLSASAGDQEGAAGA